MSNAFTDLMMARKLEKIKAELATEMADGYTSKTLQASKVFTLAGLGDSITDGTATANDADRYTDTTWLHLTHALSMGKIVPGGNFGVGGNTIAQMLARIPDVIASGATACLILGGTNDVAQLATEAEVLTNIDRLFNEGHDVLAAAGVQPIVATIPPRGRSTAASTSDQRQRIAKANARIRRYAQQRGYPLVDFHKILVDPATGMYLDAANNATDGGVHPNTVYCRKMAEAVVAAVSPMAGAFVADLAGWQTDPTNLIPNGLFLGTTSTVNGYPMPQGWNGGIGNQRAVTAPQAADNLLGNWFELYKDATQAAATAGDTTSLSPTIAAGASTFAVGDRLRFACRARISNFEGGVNSSAGTHLITLNLFMSGANVNRSPLWQWTCNIPDAVPSIEFTVPAGTTAISLQASVYGQGRLAIGQVTLRDLTKLGIA